MQMFNLLERLAEPSRIPQRTVRADNAAPLTSSGRNLERIFNTRAGSTQAPVDLGLSSSYELIPYWPKSAANFQRAIELSLEKYEPRRTRLRVVPLPIGTGRLPFRFRIPARQRGFDDPGRIGTCAQAAGESEVEENFSSVRLGEATHFLGLNIRLGDGDDDPDAIPLVSSTIAAQS